MTNARSMLVSSYQQSGQHRPHECPMHHQHQHPCMACTCRLLKPSLPFASASPPFLCSVVLTVWHQGSSHMTACQHGGLQGKDVEEIVSGWNAELEARSRAFAQHADALAEWDRHILHSRHALLNLEEEVLQVHSSPRCPFPSFAPHPAPPPSSFSPRLLR